ncbi:MAG TPA: aromatic ring-hydroxylating dioxygenase subunit alpha [Rhizomicrobium sp.]
MYPLQDGEFAPENRWYVAAWSSEVTTQPLERWFLDRPVALYRTEGGEPVALAGRCPHRQFPLGRGRVVGDDLQCGYHGFTFRPDGVCIRIPSHLRPPADCRIASYPVVEKWRWIWIWMGDPAKADASLIPDHGALGLPDPAFEMIADEYLQVKCRYLLLHDNLFDLTHLSFLHQSNIGSDDIGAVVESRRHGEDWVSSERAIKGAACPAFFAPVFDYSGLVDRDFGLTLHYPCLHAGFDRFYKAGAGQSPASYLGAFRVYHAVTPATRDTTHYFFASGRDMAKGDPVFTEQIRQGGLAVLKEDVMACEEVERMLATLPSPPKEYPARSDATGLLGRRIFQRMIRDERRAVDARAAERADPVAVG